MKKKKIVNIFIIFFLVVFMSYFFFKKTKNIDLATDTERDISINSNMIENVNYTSKDAKGNEYVINAAQGEIDYNNENIIFLTNVTATIRLTTSNEVIIKSDFGKYNTINFDTIFSKNVRVDYLENTITGEYLDFSINRNSMIISKNVVYTNIENILKADVIEINIQTKDTKIYMHNIEDKVNIRSKSSNGNN